MENLKQMRRNYDNKLSNILESEFREKTVTRNIRAVRLRDKEGKRFQSGRYTSGVS